MTANNELSIRSFSSKESVAYYQINKEWLLANDLMEPMDEAELQDPESCYIKKGGAVWVACRGEEIVGTAAVFMHNKECFELANLAVKPTEQRKGIGEKLLDVCIEFMKSKQASSMILVSNSKLMPALSLYRSYGFSERPLPQSVRYETADVCLELTLER